jgi:hypothetical protein
MRTRTVATTLTLILATTLTTPSLAQEGPDTTQLAALDTPRQLSDLDLSLNTAQPAARERRAPLLSADIASQAKASVTTDLSPDVKLQGVYRLVISR